VIIDSSAIVAILTDEPEKRDFLRRLATSPTAPKMSAANYVEVGIVIDGLGKPAITDRIDQLIAETPIEIVSVSAELARIAREAHRRFGRRSGSPAKLNFGDCFAYALARQSGEPLLFKGNDFSQTDLIVA
jgi:ribonuclease VapC